MDVNIQTVFEFASNDAPNARPRRDFVTLINGSWRKGAGDSSTAVGISSPPRTSLRAPLSTSWSSPSWTSPTASRVG